MAIRAKTEKKEPKGAGRKRGPPNPAGESKTKTTAGRAQVVKNMLTRIEEKMGTDGMKATMGDYIRLVQLHKELDDESPKEIKVTWVEPAGDKAEKTKSGKEE